MRRTRMRKAGGLPSPQLEVSLTRMRRRADVAGAPALRCRRMTWCLQVYKWSSGWKEGVQSGEWIIKGAERAEEGDGLHALAEAQGCQRGQQGRQQHGEEEEQE